MLTATTDLALGERLAASVVSARLMAATRITIGVAVLLRWTEARTALPRLTDPDLLTVPRADWLPTPSTGLVNALLALWLLGGLSVLVGFRPRLGALAAAVSIGTVLLLDEQTWGNHLYLMTLLLVIVSMSDSSAAWSVDAQLDGERPTVPLMGSWLLRFQLSVLYGFATLQKLSEDWFSGEPLNAALGGGLIGIPSALRTVAVIKLMAWATIGIELLLAVGFWTKRFRGWALLSGVGLHLSIIALMAPTLQLVTFALLAFSVYPHFFTDRWPPVATTGGGDQDG